MNALKVPDHVPVLDLLPEVEELWSEFHVAIDRVLRSTKFIMGPDVQAFEQEVASYLGAKHAVAVNSGTDGLVIALRAMGIGPGDEVITTPFSFFATAESISAVGAEPVFVDIEPASLNIDVTQIAERIGPKTKAILPVHLFGYPCPMEEIVALAQEHGLKVLEDCAQSFGARRNGRLVGTFGNAAAYSFFPSKNLGAYGDGGLIATNDDDLADLAQRLRAHGGKQKYHNELVGYNSRLDSLQAAILRVKLPHVDRWNEARRAAAQTYERLLRNVTGVVTPGVPNGHVFHQYTLRITGTDRDQVQANLREKGIDTMVYYPVPQDRLPVYADRHPANPVSDMVAGQVLSLPIGPYLSADTQEHVVSALKQVLT